MAGWFSFRLFLEQHNKCSKKIWQIFFLSIAFLVVTNLLSFSDSLYHSSFRYSSSLKTHTSVLDRRNLFRKPNQPFTLHISKSKRHDKGESEDFSQNAPVWVSRAVSFTAGLCIAVGLWLPINEPASAQGSPAMYRQATLYRTVMDTGDEELMAAANKQLLDQVWGTIGTMYYDTTGGMKFSPGYEWRQYWNQLVKERANSFKSVELTRKEIKQMLDTIQDPYAEYLSPDDIFGDKLTNQKKPVISNIGIQAIPQQVSPALLVSAVLPESPAEKAGIEIGDYILSAADWKAGFSPELSQAEIDSFFSGEDGEEVKVQVEKAKRKRGESTLQEIVLRKTRTEAPAVTSQTLNSEDGRTIGYIRIRYFNKDSTDQLISVLRNMQQEKVSIYVLDLRNNLGGVIQEAFLSSSIFFQDPKARLAYIMNSRGQYSDHDVEEYFMSQRSPGTVLNGGKIIILTNKGTASSAEELKTGLGLFIGRIVTRHIYKFANCPQPC
mmetsp:Transcript_24709/g.31956  ORF Transcript_24709/g.31956 Transcript_24709/m.31956 type:complete len:494 (-) Transcript_24709:503-1984(-)